MPIILVPADEFADITEKAGYKVVINETVPFGMAEWGAHPFKNRIKGSGLHHLLASGSNGCRPLY